MEESRPRRLRADLRSRLFLAAFVLAAVVRVAFAVEVSTRDLGLDGGRMLDMHHFRVAGACVVDGDLDMRGAYECYGFFVAFYGEERFHELYGREPLAIGPLYPYVVAAGLGASGSTLSVRLFQIALNLACCVLVFLLARACGVPRRTAALAMALFALHPTSLFYAGYLLRATLISFLLLSLALTCVLVQRRAEGRWAAAAGVVLGLLHLTKTSLAFGAPLVVAAVVAARAPAGRRAKLGALVAAAFAVCVLPLVVRNARSGCAPLHNESFAHYNVVTFHQPEAEGDAFVIPPVPSTRALIQASSGSLPDTLQRTIALHDGVGGWIRLELSKLRCFWSGSEGKNNLDPHLGKRLYSSLKLTPALSLFLLPLGLVGALVGLGRWRRLWPVYAGLGITLATCLAAASLARYRVPAFGFVAIFAALTCARLLGKDRRARITALLLLVPALVLAVPVRDTARAEHQVESHLCEVGLHAGDLERAQFHAVRAAELHPLSTAPPLKARLLPNGEPWKEWLALVRRAHGLSTDLGLEADAQRMRALLARHLRVE